jgi:hypothetical protein
MPRGELAKPEKSMQCRNVGKSLTTGIAVKHGRAGHVT